MCANIYDLIVLFDQLLYICTVSRIEARGEKDNMYLLLDVATTIYPMEEGKSYNL
jgi:hypothetical protein